MKMNFFLPMEPSTAYMNMNWMFIFLLPLAILSLYYFSFPSRFNSSNLYMMNLLKKELYPNINKIDNYTILLPFLSLFFLTMIMNFMSMFPYIFTLTSHMIVNFPMALIMWLTFIIFSWTKNTKKMFIHLIPLNTPSFLIPFLILIEFISQLIRPITLSIRLTTNSIAGHLLLILLSSLQLSLSASLYLLSTPIMLMLTLLEIAVAFIQAYVFSILATLYLKDIN